MFVFGLVLFSVVSLAFADSAASCDYIKNNFLLQDFTQVKDCFDQYTVPHDFVQAIYRNLERIGDFYPYVDINRNPPKNPPDYFTPVDYSQEMDNLKQRFEKSDDLLPNVIRPTQEFLAKFRDGHFSLRFHENKTENLFANVYVIFPFAWNLQNDEVNTASVHIVPNQWTPLMFDQLTTLILGRKQMFGIGVKSVDGGDAYQFFDDFFGVYNFMKSRQGSLQLSRYLSQNAYPFLSAPLKMLFKNHTIEFTDGDTLVFSMGFLNMKNKPPSTKIGDFPFASSKLKEADVARIVKSYKPRILKGRDLLSNKYVQCGAWKGMNYLIIGTFSAGDNDGVKQYMDELKTCISTFDENADPISVVLPFNRGGYLALEELLEFWLMPNTDYRFLVAVRKTDSSEHMLIDLGIGTIFADMNNSCNSYSYKDVKKIWAPTVIDDFGNGVKHVRSAKYFIAYKEELAPQAGSALRKHVRKPTDIIIATDGYCFSACSVFVLNSIRKGSAIITGFGSTNPDDNLFVAAQCPSTVVELDIMFDDLKNNSYYGIEFSATFMESYNISTKMSEVVPGDFEVMRIDKHLGYAESFNPIMEEFVPYLQYAHKEFQTTCNPLNTRLFFVTNNCSSDDPNALNVGYPCGSDGKWDSTQCRISTCQPGYVVDFETDKCVENICDPRVNPPPPSSSHGSSSGSSSERSESSASIVNPLMFITVFALLLLAYTA